MDGGFDDSLLLILFFFGLGEEFGLVHGVIETSQLIQVEELSNNEDSHDWAHSSAVLHFLVHHGFGFIITVSHEEVHEGLTLLLGHTVNDEEAEESANGLFEDHMNPPVLLGAGSPQSTFTNHAKDHGHGNDSLKF